ncbi:MAG: sigma-70 family RNA polymerase sigma factor [Bacteroidetes bacterium]|nr:sigma-70 family RNA polymerase sigma factor [Bacteroidota bacterium]
MAQQEIIPHLFRTEFRKITAVLCSYFGAGAEGLSIAEDIAGETFLSALENWPYKGVPEQPVAWLYTVAKNKAINYLRRHKHFHLRIAPQLKNGDAAEEMDIDWSAENIKDSQLRMLFAVCHPALSMESQISLALRVLCGFGIDEIASALLSNKETISKRLQRAKEKLRHDAFHTDFHETAVVTQRLEAVLTTLYLLFNEGYYSESNDMVLREDLCFEAMRLTQLLLDNAVTNVPNVNALFALMCFHASRFEARKKDNGALILYHEQDDRLWNRELIQTGVQYLLQAAQGTTLSAYHLEASIAYWFTVKTNNTEKWKTVLYLYNLLLQVQYSPVSSLNRVYALAMVEGPAAGIAAAEQLRLEQNPYYFSLLGTLYQSFNIEKAKRYFDKAIVLAKTKGDKEVLQRKREQLK